MDENATIERINLAVEITTPDGSVTPEWITYIEGEGVRPMTFLRMQDIAYAKSADGKITIRATDGSMELTDGREGPLDRDSAEVVLTEFMTVWDEMQAEIDGAKCEVIR